jgi:hypothetical protein
MITRNKYQLETDINIIIEALLSARTFRNVTYRPVTRPRGTLYPQKLALTSPTSGGLSVGISSLAAQATEIVFFLFGCHYRHCATSRKVAGSSLNEIINFFFLNLHNHSDRIMTRGKLNL